MAKPRPSSFLLPNSCTAPTFSSYQTRDLYKPNLTLGGAERRRGAVEVQRRRVVEGGSDSLLPRFQGSEQPDPPAGDQTIDGPPTDLALHQEGRRRRWRRLTSLSSGRSDPSVGRLASLIGSCSDQTERGEGGLPAARGGQGSGAREERRARRRG
uniref:Uncharacterized protein n=1 Tax=Oryza glumipatula TaxID=40148 RepID=A0A0D9ZWR7_9ORYZ